MITSVRRGGRRRSVYGCLRECGGTAQFGGCRRGIRVNRHAVARGSRASRARTPADRAAATSGLPQAHAAVAGSRG